MAVTVGSANKRGPYTVTQHYRRLVLLTAARGEWRLTVGMKTGGLDATFETYRTEMLLLVRTL